jgi:hypothetical protein
MRKLWIAMSIAALALAASVSANGSVRSKSGTRAQSLQVTLTLTSQYLLHNGQVTPATPSTKYAPGDNVYFTADISRGGHKIGREDGICGMTSAVIQLCTSVDHVPGGTIVHIGANSITSETFTDAITGGTGRFARAAGAVTGTFTGATSITQTYRLR